MPTLHLGVLVSPYELYGRGRTTYDVASLLEAKYGVMAHFWQAHKARIADNVAASAAATLETTLATGHVTKPFAGAMSKTATAFRRFISDGEAEHVGMRGVPTEAALHGVAHRRAHPYRKSNPRRPSFRDTGLYMRSFRAWID